MKRKGKEGVYWTEKKESKGNVMQDIKQCLFVYRVAFFLSCTDLTDSWKRNQITQNIS